MSNHIDQEFAILVADLDSTISLPWLSEEEPFLIDVLLASWVAVSCQESPSALESTAVISTPEGWQAAASVRAVWVPGSELPLSEVDNWMRAINGLRMAAHAAGANDVVGWLGSVLERTLAEL